MHIYKDLDRTVVVEKDLHDQIMIEIVKYFEASELWETKGWDYKGVEARNALGRLRLVARKRRMEIQEKRKQRKKRPVIPKTAWKSKEDVKNRYTKKKGEVNE